MSKHAAVMTEDVQDAERKAQQFTAATHGTMRLLRAIQGKGKHRKSLYGEWEQTR